MGPCLLCHLYNCRDWWLLLLLEYFDESFPPDIGVKRQHTHTHSTWHLLLFVINKNCAGGERESLRVCFWLVACGYFKCVRLCGYFYPHKDQMSSKMSCWATINQPTLSILYSIPAAEYYMASGLLCGYLIKNKFTKIMFFNLQGISWV